MKKISPKLDKKIHDELYFYPKVYGLKRYNPAKADFSLMYLGDGVQLGIVAKHQFETGSIIAQMCGEIVDDVRQHTLQISANKHMHDIYFCGFILHSCDPNTQLDPKSRHLTTIQPIDIGDIITMDYSLTEDRLFKQFKCQCQAKNCRGWIAGRQESAQNEQTRDMTHNHIAIA